MKEPKNVFNFVYYFSMSFQQRNVRKEGRKEGRKEVIDSRVEMEMIFEK